jgi:hypothetical protein
MEGLHGPGSVGDTGIRVTSDELLVGTAFLFTSLGVPDIIARTEGTHGARVISASAVTLSALAAREADRGGRCVDELYHGSCESALNGCGLLLGPEKLFWARVSGIRRRGGERGVWSVSWTTSNMRMLV